ncbi:MAG TPA: hypothetical protein VF702_14830 [Allosphingosinicella sp.]|jgi:hypothetical protein
MKSLSLMQAWNEAAAFVRREARLIFPIALLLNALPMAFAAALMPEFAEGRMPQAGLWMGLIPAAAAIGILGHVAISHLILFPGRTVREALACALRRFPALLGLYLLVLLGLGLALLLLSLAAALFGRGGAPGAGAAASILFLPLVVLLLFVGTRLLLTSPIAAAEPGGPLAVGRRSWRLTQPWFWPLLCFLVLTNVAASALSFVLRSAVQVPIELVSGPPGPGSAGAILLLLVGALVGATVTAYVTAAIARIYACLATASPAAASGT